MPLIRCPACDATEDLVGVDEGRGGTGDEGARAIECGSCGHRWRRDLTPTCQRCGSTALEPVLTATLEEAGRGDMRTPSGIRTLYRCRDCGARDATSSTPIAPNPDDAGARRTRVRLPAREPAADAGPTSAHRTSVDSAFGRFEVGATVGGRWRLTSLLRWSSTGTVWAAEDRRGSGQRVTFKLVHPPLTRTEEAARLHVASARAAARVRAPGLLRILDVKRRGDHVLVVAEHVDAPTLADVLADGDRLQADTLSGSDLLAATRSVGAALATMHAQELAHLDIRPDKVLLPDTGPAQLVDLGSGRVRARTERVSFSDDRAAWQAPEQIIGDRHGPSADVYRFALTCWVACGGRLADLGADPATQASHRLEHDLPVDVLPAAPAELVAIIRAGGRRRPEDRPTMAELLDG